MARVFISHANDGQDLAVEVHRWLVAAGHEVFLDRDRRDGIVVGDQWRQRLHEQLRWADAVVCVVTSAYLTSRWCAAEVEIARSRGSRLMPVQAEAGVIDPSLESSQHVDMAGDPVGARAALVAGLRRVDAAGGVGWPDERSPFPGLHSFDIAISIGCFSVATLRRRSSPSGCVPLPCTGMARCCWWWAPRDAASPRWFARGCCR